MSVNKKKQKQARDAAGTNDSSVLSKVSAATQGYFLDDYLKHFVCKVYRRAPLINRGYYVRWKAIDHCVKQFLRVTESCPRRQVLTLGAGFDSLYFRLHAEGALNGLVLFELDFPDVTRRKAALISNSTPLKECLGPFSHSTTGPVYVHGDQYCLLGVDVRENAQVEEALSGAGLDWSAPTLLLSEVVLTYMETQWSDAVICWAARLLPQSLFVMYEQIRPHNPFGRVMEDHFLKLNSTLHALRRYPDLAAQTNRFLDRGWEQCVCLDMNDFYLGHIAEKERCRVESLEPFDEFEEWHHKCSHYFILTASRGSLTSQALLSHPTGSPIPAVRALLSSHSLVVRPMDGDLCVEGLGMASVSLAPGLVLLSGGSGRGGRGHIARVLVRKKAGWRCASVDSSTDWAARLHHTVTLVPGWGAVVFGGRSSPLNPIRTLLRVTGDACDLTDPVAPGDQALMKLSVTEMVCSGQPPRPRWRHTATLLRHKGQNFLFVFGGRSEAVAGLGDAHFLCIDDQRWTEIPIEGTTPEPRFSHSACPYAGGAVICGGLGGGSVPLGDTVILRPTPTGFRWEKLLLLPALVPRYSHSAHVIGDRLVLVGGVWLQADGVPGVAVADLTTGASVEFGLDTSAVPWPLMLHCFCSELLDDSDGSTTVALIGGGGNCFSFGTHHNPGPVTVDLKDVL
uniref:tRNA wybutosine-synthesizing protein 4 n=1 Tax=Esox lucius TaxID=8010 RepID=A0A3P8ZJF8_ESOLU